MPKPSFQMLSSQDPDVTTVDATWTWDWSGDDRELRIVFPCAHDAFRVNDLIRQAYELGATDAREKVINHLQIALNEASR